MPLEGVSHCVKGPFFVLKNPFFGKLSISKNGSKLWNGSKSKTGSKFKNDLKFKNGSNSKNGSKSKIDQNYTCRFKYFDVEKIQIAEIRP